MSCAYDYEYEEDIDTDLYCDESDTNLEQDKSECSCGNVCMRCLGMSDRDFM